MPGRTSRPQWLRYLGATVALVAAVGYTVLGWRFGQPDGPLPLALGVAFAVVAVGWTLYRRVVTG